MLLRYKQSRQGSNLRLRSQSPLLCRFNYGSTKKETARQVIWIIFNLARRKVAVSKTERDLYLEGKCPLRSLRTREHLQHKEFLSFSVSTPRKWNLLQFYLLLFFPPNSFIKLMRQQETSLSLRLTCQRKVRPTESNCRLSPVVYAKSTIGILAVNQTPHIWKA